MTGEQIKTAMAKAWLDLEVDFDMRGETLSDRDRQLWTLGFSTGGVVAARNIREFHEALFAEEDKPEGTQA